MGYYSGSSQPSGSAMDEWKRGASQLLDSAATKEQPETVESETAKIQDLKRLRRRLLWRDRWKSSRSRRFSIREGPQGVLT